MRDNSNVHIFCVACFVIIHCMKRKLVYIINSKLCKLKNFFSTAVYFKLVIVCKVYKLFLDIYSSPHHILFYIQVN